MWIRNTASVCYEIGLWMLNNNTAAVQRKINVNILQNTFLFYRDVYTMDTHKQAWDVYEMIFKDKLKAGETKHGPLNPF
jgi:hypothetical protein